MGSKKVSAPAPRDYKQEMLDTMAGQEAIQPRLLALEQQYQPLYQKLQQDLMDRQSKYLMESYGKLIPESASLSKQYAESMSPVYGTIGAGARSAYEQGLGEQTMGLYNTIQREAQKNLEAGYGLTPEAERLAQQSARAAMTARGLAGGNQGIAQEILNSYNLQQNRYKSALEQAQSAYTMGANQYGQALNAYGTPMIQQAGYLSPYSTYNTAYNATQGLGAKIFQPESQYNAQLITANRKEAMDAQIANAQSQSALTSGLMGAVGAIGGGFLGNPALFGGVPKPTVPCWVAREVYGEENPKWLFFREWLETSSPKWFHQLYLEEGERFAKYIKDKPFLKAVIKFGMDSVIKFNYNSNQVII